MSSRPTYAAYPQYQYQKIDNKFVKYTNIPYAYTNAKPKKTEEAEGGSGPEIKEPENAADNTSAPDAGPSEAAAPLDSAKSEGDAVEESAPGNAEAEAPAPSQEASNDDQKEVVSEPEAAPENAEVPPVAPDPPTESSETQVEAEPPAEEVPPASAPTEPEVVAQDVVEPAPPEEPAEIKTEPTTDEVSSATNDASNNGTTELAPEEPSSQEKAPAKAKKGKKVQLKAPPKQSTKKTGNTEKTEKPKEKAKAAVKTKKGAKTDKKKAAKAVAAGDTPAPTEDVKSKEEAGNQQVEAPSVEAPKVETDTTETSEQPAVTEAPEVASEVASEVVPEAAPEITPEAEPEVTPEVIPEAASEAIPEAVPEAVPENSSAEPSENASGTVEPQEVAETDLPNGNEVVQSEASQSITQNESTPENAEVIEPTSLPQPIAENEPDASNEAVKQLETPSQSTPEDDTTTDTGEITHVESPPQPVATNEINIDNETSTQSETVAQAVPDNETVPDTGNDPVVAEAAPTLEKSVEAETEAEVKSEQMNEETSQSVPVAEINTSVDANSENHITEDTKQEVEETSAPDDTANLVVATEEPDTAQEQGSGEELPVKNQAETNQKDEVMEAEKPSVEATLIETEPATEVKENVADTPLEPSITDIAEPPVDHSESDSTTVEEVSNDPKSTTETADVSTDSTATISNITSPAPDLDIVSTDQPNSPDVDDKTTPVESAGAEVEAQQESSPTVEEEPGESSQEATNTDIKSEAATKVDSDVKAVIDIESNAEVNQEGSPEMNSGVLPEEILGHDPENKPEAAPESCSKDEPIESAVPDNSEHEAEKIVSTEIESQAKDSSEVAGSDDAKILHSMTGDSEDTAISNDTNITIPETSNEEAIETKVDEQAIIDSQIAEQVPVSVEQPDSAPEVPAEVNENAAPSKVEDPIEVVDASETEKDDKEISNEEKSEEIGEPDKHDQTNLPPEPAISEVIASAPDNTEAKIEEIEAKREQPENPVEEVKKDISLNQKPYSAEENIAQDIGVVSSDNNLPEHNHIAIPDDVDNRSTSAVCDDQAIDHSPEDVPQEDIPREDVPQGDAPKEDSPKEDSPKEIPAEEQETKEAVLDIAKDEPKPAESITNDANLIVTEPPNPGQEPNVSDTIEPLEASRAVGEGVMADTPSHGVVPEVISVPILNDKEREKKRHKRRSTTEHHHRHHDAPHSESKSKNSEGTHESTTKAKMAHSQRAAESHFRRHKTVDAGSETQPQMTSRRDHHDTGHIKVSKSQNHHSRPETERKSSNRPSPTSGEPQRPKHERMDGSYRSMKSEPGREKSSQTTNSFGLNAIGRALRPKLFTGNKAQSEMSRSTQDSSKHETQDLKGQSPPTTRAPRSPAEPKMQRSYSEHKPTRSEEETARRLAHTRRREREAKDAANADAARRSARREAHRLEHDKDQRRTEAEKSDRTRRKHTERRNSKEATDVVTPEDENPGVPEDTEAEREPPQQEPQPEQDDQVPQHHHHRHHHHRTSSYANVDQGHSPDKDERREPHRTHRRQSYIGDHPRKTRGDGNHKDKKNESATAPVGLFKRIFGN